MNCEALYQAGCCDQLNFGGLMCLEVLARRISAVVMSMANPGRPQWEAARHFAGLGSLDDVARCPRSQTNEGRG